MANDDLTLVRLRELLTYNPDTGVFIRKLKSRPDGKVAGNRDACGYLQLKVAGKMRLAHRLAWLWMTGEFPSMDIDHINGIKDDNRWSNLRHVDRATNAQNQRLGHRDGSSGTLGVLCVGDKWYAAITSRGQRKHLGTFRSQEDAEAAYLAAKRRLHDGCTI
jgi:hypothetical protein